MEWAAQRGGGVTDPGGVQRAFGCCVEGHGLAGTIGEGRMVGLDDPVGLSNLSDYMILFLSKRKSSFLKMYRTINLPLNCFFEEYVSSSVKSHSWTVLRAGRNS